MEIKFTLKYLSEHENTIWSIYLEDWTYEMENKLTNGESKA